VAGEVAAIPRPSVYKALLTQVDTDAPIASILFNTIGNIVWTYLGTGLYLGTLAGAFTEGRTAVTNRQSILDGVGFVVWAKWSSSDTITVFVSGVDGGASDSELENTLIQIEVY